MRKVFISSVMDDFGSERQAAKSAVEALGMRPVMAEDFGPKPYSSQVACREGVRQSDVYVGIAGNRYGFVGSSGISVTEEEFNEARQRGLPILWLIKDADRESAQQEFVDRVTGYEEGHFVRFFDTLDQLVTGITGGLNSLAAGGGATDLTADTAARHTRAIIETCKPLQQRYDPVLMAVTVPVRQGEPYLSPLDLEQDRDRLLQPAMFGATAVLDRHMGVDDVEGVEDLTFEQRESHGDVLRRLQVSTDGTVVWQHSQLTEREVESHLLGYILDQDEVRRRLAAFLSYANWFYGQLDDAPLISSVYVSMGVLGSDRWFGQMPSHPVRSMQMPPGQVEDPLIVPRKPHKASRAHLADPVELATTLVGLLARAYRAAGQDYERKG